MPKGNIDMIFNNLITAFVSILVVFISAVLGYFLGIIQERKQIIWKENRAALQTAYAYFDVLIARMKDNSPINNELFEQLKDLKYKKNFNLTNKKLFTKIRELLEMPIYDINHKEYNLTIKDDYIKEVEKILPIIKQEMEYIRTHKK